MRSGFLWQQWQKDAQEKSEVKREIKGIKRIWIYVLITEEKGSHYSRFQDEDLEGLPTV